MFDEELNYFLKGEKMHLSSKFLRLQITEQKYQFFCDV